MSDFLDLAGEVADGINGKNSGIPMGFTRLNNHISIRKAIYFLLGGWTGSGKTSLVDDAFVLNPLDYVLLSKDPEIDMHIIYVSQERRKAFKLAKWISRKIFLDTGIVIPVNRIMGWVAKERRLTKDEHNLFLHYEAYIDSLMSKITFLEGPQNPTGVRKFVDSYAAANGNLNNDNKYNPIYTANNPHKIVMIITDTVGLTKGEKEFPKGKPAIDKSSEDKQRFRDLYGYTIVDISQFNRDIANPMRLKNGDTEPQLEDFKETGSTQENADVVLSLFDPYRYNVADPSRYELGKLRDKEGRKLYRNLKILKNSYGSDDIRIGLALLPEVGLFKEMPKLNNITDSDYEAILDNTYFMKEYK